MRNMSFMLTTEQLRNKTKTVTRRNGWKNIKSGELIQGVVKCMGLKKGEKMEKIHVILILFRRREPLNDIIYDAEYGREEMIKEGFPSMHPEDFVSMYCKHNKCKSSDIITRIEFEYVN